MDIDKFLNDNKIKPTALRKKMIEILAKAPTSYAELTKLTGANKSTIYRNLDLFEKHMIVISGENSGKKYYDLATHAKAYFICEKCHMIKEIKMPNLEIENIKSVIVKGTCDECI
ncbi:MAG: Fur family transcriptional regulator [Campylobacter sp.]|nr:Fur family transcriptional regulator [Campylobacter sp.]